MRGVLLCMFLRFFFLVKRKKGDNMEIGLLSLCVMYGPVHHAFSQSSLDLNPWSVHSIWLDFVRPLDSILEVVHDQREDSMGTSLFQIAQLNRINVAYDDKLQFLRM